MRWVRADAPRRPVLFVNPKSGGGKAGRARLDQVARERDIEAVVLEFGADLAALAEEAVGEGADALGMAGGDGSLATVASVARAHGLPFVCVPAGTRNHFARDLGLAPDDLMGSLDAFTDGLEGRIDVAEVNGRQFMNNVSLGIYGAAVQRDGYRSAKARTLFETARGVAGPAGELPSVHVVDDGGVLHTDPAVVLVSNNAYAAQHPRSPGMRPALDTGLLGVLTLDRPGGGGRRPARAWTAPSLRITAGQALAAGVDGEAVRLSPPLQFDVASRALRVRVPVKRHTRTVARRGPPRIVRSG